MLVISRYIDETLLLYRGRRLVAEVKLVALRCASGDKPKVRVGIEAPDDITVLRPEHVEDYLADSRSSVIGGAA